MQFKNLQMSIHIGVPKRDTGVSVRDIFQSFVFWFVSFLFWGGRVGFLGLCLEHAIAF